MTKNKLGFYIRAPKLFEKMSYLLEGSGLTEHEFLLLAHTVAISSI
jgi:hypothetical protein